MTPPVRAILEIADLIDTLPTVDWMFDLMASAGSAAVQKAAPEIPPASANGTPPEHAASYDENAAELPRTLLLNVAPNPRYRPFTSPVFAMVPMSSRNEIVRVRCTC
eukprot:CAMPEP_0179445982 /NCGR_PEP_ID=MMETSP0799-20121207/29417_1 /TAXON_ID=46947 /ORGANISM="Geminigera cryophila, Strain CCMP2564" /LENGTH=106 /DNA_ID=CAMNT_0021234547 /DNA_START=535 /DNA_END=855 /DNA_ORIENTATION=-